MCQAMRNLCRLDATRFEVLAFEARNRDQRAVRRSLLEELDLVESYDCRPGREQAFERSWERIERLHTALTSPELAWTPSWLSRALWEARTWLWGGAYRVREWWWRAEGRLDGMRERLRATWWCIQARFW